LYDDLPGLAVSGSFLNRNDIGGLAFLIEFFADIKVF